MGVAQNSLDRSHVLGGTNLTSNGSGAKKDTAMIHLSIKRRALRPSGDPDPRAERGSLVFVRSRSDKSKMSDNIHEVFAYTSRVYPSLTSTHSSRATMKYKELPKT
jgi:hypothetical protein